MGMSRRMLLDIFSVPNDKEVTDACVEQVPDAWQFDS